MRSSNDENSETGTLEETRSGIDIWTGLMPLVEEVQADRDPDLQQHALFVKVDRLFERYRWFTRRLDLSRDEDACRSVLGEPPREPGAWQRALVELSLLGTARAQVYLDEWDPPDCPAYDLDIELFRRICAVKCDSN